MLAVAHRAVNLTLATPNWTKRCATSNIGGRLQSSQQFEARHFVLPYVTGELSPGGGSGCGFGFGLFGSGFGFCCIVSSYSGCGVASTLDNTPIAGAFLCHRHAIGLQRIRDHKRAGMDAPIKRCS